MNRILFIFTAQIITILFYGIVFHSFAPFFWILAELRELAEKSHEVACAKLKTY